MSEEILFTPKRHSKALSIFWGHYSFKILSDIAPVKSVSSIVWFGNVGLRANLIFERTWVTIKVFICLDSLADNEPSARKERN